MTWTTDSEAGAVETIWHVMNPSRGSENNWMFGQARVRTAGHDIDNFQLTFLAKTTSESLEDFHGFMAIDDIGLHVTNNCDFHPSYAAPETSEL